jgi:hypothetical protein
MTGHSSELPEFAAELVCHLPAQGARFLEEGVEALSLAVQRGFVSLLFPHGSHFRLSPEQVRCHCWIGGMCFKDGYLRLSCPVDVEGLLQI